ncbi:MAG: ABC transporter permease subunit [Desulfomonilaceae bacterium]|jgi:phosphate transport system permease protein
MATFRQNSFFQGTSETVIKTGLFFATLVAAFVVIVIFGFICYFALPIFHEEQISTVLSWSWKPVQGQFGIIPMAIGSICLGATSMCLAFPVGLGVCCCASGLAPKWFSSLILLVVRLMTSVPTVVYGFVSVFLLVPMVRGAFHHGTGFSWLAASITLSALVLPTVVLLIHTQFEQIDPGIRLTAAALGFKRVSQIVWVLIPASYQALFAAGILGFGRAVGDTIISLMLAGNAPQIPDSLLDSIRTLTAHIALVVSTEAGSSSYNSLFASGIILFGMSAAVNGTLRFIRLGARVSRDFNK